MKKAIFLVLSLLSFTIASNYLWVGNYTNQSYSFFNITFEGKKYALISLQNQYLLWNYSSKNYVTNSSIAFNVIKNYYTNLSNSLIQAQKPTIIAKINSFVNGFWRSFYDCYSLLGLTSGLSCTVANWCVACTTVPSCNAYINPMPNVPGSGSGGKIFVVWASIFASDSQIQNKSIRDLINSVSSMNVSNFNSNFLIANKSIYLISRVVRNMTLNGILNMSPTRYDTFGYCLPIQYNRTLLSQINSSLYYIYSQVYTDAKIQNIAKNIETTTMQLIIIPQQKKEFALYQAQFSLINRNYTNSVLNATNALKIFRFSQLQKDLNALKLNYSYFNSTISNVSIAHSLLRSLINRVNEESSLVLNLSKNINATLNQTFKKSFVYYIESSNSTYLEKLRNISSSLPYATYENAAIAYSSILNYSSTLDNLLKNDFVFYIKKFIKSTFGFGRVFSKNIYLSNTISLAIYSIFVISIASLIIYTPIYYYKKLKKKRKIKVNAKSRRNWYTLFVLISIIVGALAIFFIFLGYTLTVKAPYALFAEELSKKALILVATNNKEANACASSIAKNLNASFALINFTSGVCSINNSTFEKEHCLKNSPTIIIQISNFTKITPVSFASSYLIIQGNSSFFSACEISRILK
ncbi:MAG: hypothetical protein ACPLXS_02920 [Candidatus Micrarchaeales archaeon]